MTYKKLPSLRLTVGLLLAVPAVGCPADDPEPGEDTGADDGGSADDGPTGGDGTPTAGDDSPTAGDGMDTPDGSGDDGGAACPGAGGAAADGEACTSNGDCMSGVCLLFNDVPVPDDAVCGELPADCNTRITATVYDFEAGSRIGDIGVRVGAAVQVSLDPAGADAILEGTTDAEGRFDETSAMPIMAAIGIVGLVENDDFFLTATGISSPSSGANYDVGSGNHELWAVPKATLTTWSDALAMDESVPAASLPLGEEGGVVGLVRNDVTGDPINRAVVAPDDENSASIVRYLADDGSWTTDGTGAAGIFTIINPALAETFHVEIDGNNAGGDGTAGSAPGAIFTLIMSVDG